MIGWNSRRVQRAVWIAGIAATALLIAGVALFAWWAL